MNLSKRAIISVLWNSAGNYIRFTVNFIGQILLVRLLFPEDFGAFAFALSILEVLSFLISSGFSLGIIQMQEEDDLSDTAFCLTIVQSLLFFIVIGFISLILILKYSNFIFAYILMIVGIARTLNPLAQIYVAHLQKQLLFKSISFAIVISSIASVILSVVLAFYGFGIWSLVAKEFLDGFITLIIFKYISGWKFKWHLNKSLAKKLLSFGGKIYLIGWLERLAFRVDMLIGGFLMKPAALGFYSQARYLVSLPCTAVAPMMGSVLVSIYSKVQNDELKLKEASSVMNFFLVRLLLLVSVFFFFFSDEIIILLYGEKWKYSAVSVKFLALYPLFASLFENQKLLLQGTGKLWKPVWALSIQILSTMILFVLGFKTFGLLGASFGYLISVMIGYFIIYVVNFKYLASLIKDNLYPILSTISVSFFVYIIKPHIFCSSGKEITFIWFIPLMIFIYAGILFLFEHKFIGENIEKFLREGKS